MSQTALLEIGVEEIPAHVVLPALEQMAVLTAAGLEKRRLSFGPVRTMGTPRRLAVLVSDLAERQPDQELEVKGPAAAAAFDKEGKPTKAAEGFARGRGVSLSELELRETDKGAFVFARVREVGRPATEVLAELWPEVIRQLTFPKTMRWGDLDVRFARPIRWLAALYRDQPVTFEVAGVASGTTSRGHRFLHPGPVELASAEGYEQALEAAFVIADHGRRKDLIAQQARAAAATVGGGPRIAPALLEEVAFLVEYPTCLVGSFPERHLALPEPVLVTVMAKHQRYFPVEERTGGLLPCFIAVRNGDDRSLGTVTSGNEKVIEARFADAEFYYAEDTRRPLSAHLPDLERVTYMERQGSMREKTDRIVALARELAAEVGLSGDESQTAARAAELCKCDLVTLMVQDLTSLQGVIGGVYGRLEGVSEAVCHAIAEHYAPRAADDAPPTSNAGRVVSLADKLDNLAACFALSMVPKGTSDPYALRRQAAGILAILLDARWRVDLPARLAAALERLPRREASDEAALGALGEFVGLRLDAALEAQGVAYDIRRAVLGAPCPDLVDAYDRALSLEDARRADVKGFETVTFAAARIGKIVRPALEQAADEVKPALFEKAVESVLWDALGKAEARVEALLGKPGDRDYAAAWAALSELERPVWDYFDVKGVMVMAEDRSVRASRLALLHRADRLFLRLADFTEIVVE
jgi:glycyl-tRNA synthetase beta chain